MRKFLRVGAILLFFVVALVQPNEACRVLIKGKEEVWANNKPSILVFQTLQKGTEPSPGNPIGYTPGSPRPLADTTDTRAFKGKEEARANDEKSILVLQTLPMGTVPPPGNPTGYTPGSPRPLAETTNTRAFKGKKEAWANDKPSIPVFQTLQKGTEPSPGNPIGYAPSNPRPPVDTTNTRAFKGREEVRANDKKSVLVLQTLQKGTVPPPGNSTGYTPSSPRPLAETTNTRAFKGKEEAWANDKTSVLVRQTLPMGMVPPPGNPTSYTLGNPRPLMETTNTRAFKGKEEAWANDKMSVLALQTLQKGTVPPPGNPTGYTPSSPRPPLIETTNTRAFKGIEKGRANNKPSVLALQTLQKGTVPPPGNSTGYTPGSPRLLAETTNTRAFKGKEEAWANDKTSVLVLQTLPMGMVPPPGNPTGYTLGNPRPLMETTNTRAFKGKEEAWANDKTSVLALQTLQKGTVPPPGNPTGYTPSSPRPPLVETTNTRAFKGIEKGRANDKMSVLVLQTLEKGPVPPPRNLQGYTPGTPKPPSDINTRAFSGRATASPRVVNPITFLSHGITADRI